MSDKYNVAPSSIICIIHQLLVVYLPNIVFIYQSKGSTSHLQVDGVDEELSQSSTVPVIPKYFQSVILFLPKKPHKQGRFLSFFFK
uniref:Ovule protein n=1 Tax=Heterorhabditis bacteriophora TaxID=37862 RepID=A0A1I7X5A0_HETBA